MADEPTDYQIYAWAHKYYGRAMARTVLRALVEGGGFADHVRRSFIRDMRNQSAPQEPQPVESLLDDDDYAVLEMDNDPQEPRDCEHDYVAADIPIGMIIRGVHIVWWGGWPWRWKFYDVRSEWGPFREFLLGPVGFTWHVQGHQAPRQAVIRPKYHEVDRERCGRS